MVEVNVVDSCPENTSAAAVADAMASRVDCFLVSLLHLWDC